MKLAFAMLIASAAVVFAEVIPSARTYPWVPGVTIGVRGGIPLAGMTIWTNFVEAGAVGDGETDNYDLLNTLANTCPSNQYIYVAPGRYWTSQRVTLNNYGWALVGAHRTETIFTNTSGLFIADVASFGAPFRLHGSHEKGATNLTTTGEDMTEYVGKTIRISRSEALVPEPDLQVQDIYFTDRILNQLAVVGTVSDGTNFTIDRPLMWDFDAEYDPWIEVNSSVFERVGFANFSVHVNGSSRNAFDFFGARFIWWDTVSTRVSGGGYFLNDSYNLGFEARNCYAFTDSVGSGTALWLFTSSFGHWFENNYGIGGSPMFEINGTSGSAFTFNYATNNASDPNTGDDSYVGNPFNSHGAHAMMNLMEGNRGTMLQAPDAYFGSASHWTVFRNQFHAFDPYPRNYLPRAIDINRWGTYFNIVGNVLGSTNRTGWYYTMTNDAYDGSFPAPGPTTPTIFTFGYVAPGTRNYNQKNNGSHWKFPGVQNRIGLVTNSATVPTNRIAGTFTNVSEGDHIILQSAANTKHYYPYNTNFPRLTVSSVESAYIELSKNVTATNSDTVWKIGDGNFFDGLHTEMVSTLLIHGNTDASNGFDVIVWDRSGTVTDSNLPTSIVHGDTQPAWATNRSTGLAVQWPIVNPTNALVGDWPARSLWEDAEFSGGDPDPSANPRSISGAFKLQGNFRLQ